MYDVSFDYDETDSYHYLSMVFSEPGTPVQYRCQLQFDMDHNTLTAPGWERAWTRGDDYEDINQPSPPVLAAWEAVRWRAETWARTGADPGSAHQRVRNSLSRGSWRAS